MKSMVTIATHAQTVGDVIDQCAERLLDGILRQPFSGLKVDQEKNKAARTAVTLLVEDLKEVWCPDANTRLRDLPVPQEKEPNALGSTKEERAAWLLRNLTEPAAQRLVDMVYSNEALWIADPYMPGCYGIKGAGEGQKFLLIVYNNGEDFEVSSEVDGWR